MSDTPRTDSAWATWIANRCAQRVREESQKMERELTGATMELEALRTANAGLVEKAGETQAALDLSARQLLDTVNDRNSIGVQLDLLRDELMRIRARIGETGLVGEHPELSSIAGYCERAQKDIAVLYTPIEERDRLQREVRKMDDLRERAEERVRRLGEAAGLALGYAAKGDFESADNVLKEAKGQP